jgi:hypothetical protein
MRVKSDLYTKAVLSVIAVFLGILALRPITAPQSARAESAASCAPLQFDERLRQIEYSKGSAMGRIAIDLRNGNIYGFPTDALGYPRNPGKSEIPVSDPILLGRFNLDKLGN